MSDLTYYTDATKYPATYLSSPLLPIIISLLVGYTVAQCFFNVSSTPRGHALNDCSILSGNKQIARCPLTKECTLVAGV